MPEFMLFRRNDATKAVAQLRFVNYREPIDLWPTKPLVTTFLSRGKSPRRVPRHRLACDSKKNLR